MPVKNAKKPEFSALDAWRCRICREEIPNIFGFPFPASGTRRAWVNAVGMTMHALPNALGDFCVRRLPRKAPRPSPRMRIPSPRFRGNFPPALDIFP